MPELRQNPITKQWVIIAPERARRPHEFVQKKTDAPPVPSYVEKCPFCPGNEHLAPPESFRIGQDGKWQVRVIPNKFAALSSEDEVSRATQGLKRTVSGVGVHEVVIETPDHAATTALLAEEDVAQILESYK